MKRRLMESLLKEMQPAAAEKYAKETGMVHPFERQKMVELRRKKTSKEINPKQPFLPGMEPAKKSFGRLIKGR